MDQYLDQIMKTLQTQDFVTSNEITELRKCMRQMKTIAMEAEMLLGKLR